MSDEPWKTAAELMAELEAKPEFVARRAAKRRRREERRRLFQTQYAPTFSKLAALGYRVGSTDELVNRHAPLPAAVVAVLLEGLRPENHPRVNEMLVRTLVAAAGPYDGRPLRRCFEGTNDEGVRWAVLNTISVTDPTHVDGWLDELRSSARWGPELAKLGDPG